MPTKKKQSPNAKAKTKTVLNGWKRLCQIPILQSNDTRWVYVSDPVAGSKPRLLLRVGRGGPEPLAAVLSQTDKGGRRALRQALRSNRCWEMLTASLPEHLRRK